MFKNKYNPENKLKLFFYIFVTITVSVLGNYVAAIWAAQPDRIYTLWLPALLIVSPLVFITYGITLSRLGVSIGSATIDSLPTLGTVFVGLFIFKEYNVVTEMQMLGIFSLLCGMLLMLIKKETK